MNAEPASLELTEQTTPSLAALPLGCLESTFGGLAQLAASICQTPVASIVVTSCGQSWCSANDVLPATAVPRHDPFANYAIGATGLLEVRDASQDSRFLGKECVAGQHLICFYAGLALRTTHGGVLGTLGVYDSTPRQLSPEQRAALVLLAEQASSQAELRASLDEAALKSLFGFASLDREAQRKRTDEVLRQSETRYQSLFENMLNGFAYCKLQYDGDGRPVDFVYLSVNSAFERLTGLTNVTNRRVTDVIPGIRDLNPELFELYGRVASTGTPETFEIDLQSMRQWFHVSVYSPAKGYIVAVFDNITERKHADQAVRDSEAKLRAIYDGALDGILVADAQTKTFLTGNPAICRMLGYTLEEIVRLGVADIHPAPDLPHAVEQFARVLRGEIEIAVDIPVQRKDGSVFYADIKAASIRLGAKDGLLGIFRDITERKDADQRIRRLNRIYAVLSGINATIVRASDCTELLNEACRIAVEDGGFGIASVLLVNEDEYEIWQGPSAGADPLPLPAAHLSFRPGAETTSPHRTAIRAICERKPIVNNDIGAEPTVSPLRTQALRRGYGSIISLPIIVGAHVAAVLTLYAKERNFFDAQELRLLDELAGDIGFSLDNIEKKTKLDYLAFYDPLTGLANRALFLERANQSIHDAGQGDGKFALAILDIERFRTINDSLGRPAGDALIKLVAERVRIAGGAAAVGRLSGDHFGLILGTVTERSDADRILTDVVRMCFEEPFKLNDTDLRLSAKAGIVLTPGDGVDAEMLLANAEAALRKAKELGERHVFYTSVLTERTAERLTLENRLREALQKDEFELHYQPKVDFERRSIVGVEALIRWQSPEHGLVPPATFIPLMEETGLILDVGSWALRRAARDHRAWVAQGLQAPRVAVNVSAIQLRQRDFVRTVEQAIVEGIAPPGIDLEITESITMEDVEGNIEKLTAVRGLGLSVAIDDFGTGHSSLAYLAKLPVQALKIDRSFVSTMLNDADNMTLVQTIITLAHALRLKVIAEGVESEEQATILRLLRCDEMQGYLFSKPVPFAAMTALLMQREKA